MRCGEVMSDTSDFVNRLRGGDKVCLLIELGDEIKKITGIVSKQWTNGTIMVGDFKLRHWDYAIDDSVMSIRYEKDSDESGTNEGE